MKYIWLFSENLSETMNNNSFYLWRWIVNNSSDVNAYYIIKKSITNLKIVKTLNECEKKNIVWRDSLKHNFIYSKADMNFVTLSYRDTMPDKILRIFKHKYQSTSPVVYLQHGVLGIKEIHMKPNYANNTLFKFIYYNQKIKEKIINRGYAKEYQLLNGCFQPRWAELARRFIKNRNNPRDILYFLTWRDYIGKNWETTYFNELIINTLNNEKLISLLNKQNRRIKLCLHRQMAVKYCKHLIDQIKKNDRVDVIFANQIDLMDEIISSEYVITDYSSLAFDFRLLNKDVYLYQPDVDIYKKKRKFLCDEEEIEKFVKFTPDSLIESLANGTTSNDFFKNKIYPFNSLIEIASDYYNEKLYKTFLNYQKESISFLGYDFSGKGGSVFATHALAEGLLEKGFLVRYFSIKQTNSNYCIPNGISLKAFYNAYSNRKIDRLIRSIKLPDIFYSHLRKDPLKEYIPSICGFGFKNFIHHAANSACVVSTRDSIHYYLNEAKFKKSVKKVYIYHCQADAVEKLFPGAIYDFKKLKLDNAIFVSKTSKDNYKAKYNFDNFKHSFVIGNSLDSNRMISFNEIEKYSNDPEKIKCVYLTRISKDRIGDMNNLLEFGLFLKENIYKGGVKL